MVAKLDISRIHQVLVLFVMQEVPKIALLKMLHLVNLDTVSKLMVFALDAEPNGLVKLAIK